MKQHLTSALILCVLFGTVAAFAAALPTQGKVVAVTGDKVQIAIEGETPDWVELDANLKFKNGIGKIVEVSAPGITPVVITVKTSKAAGMKTGSTLSFEKGKAPRSGC